MLESESRLAWYSSEHKACMRKIEGKNTENDGKNVKQRAHTRSETTQEVNKTKRKKNNNIEEKKKQHRWHWLLMRRLDGIIEWVCVCVCILYVYIYLPRWMNNRRQIEEWKKTKNKASDA